MLNIKPGFRKKRKMCIRDRVISAGMEYAEHICSFAFQGGEPTLAGLEFYRGVVELQKKYQRQGVEIHNAIQTNGYLIDEDCLLYTSRPSLSSSERRVTLL